MKVFMVSWFSALDGELGESRVFDSSKKAWDYIKDNEDTVVWKGDDCYNIANIVEQFEVE